MYLHRSLLLLLLAVPASAQTARIVVSEPRGEDRAHLVAVLSDRTQVDLDLPMAQATVDGVRAALRAKIATVPVTTRVPVGTSIDLSVIVTPVPVDPPTPTPAQVWRVKVDRLVQFRALGLMNPAAMLDLQALQDDVEATYLPGYLDAF